MQDSAKSQLIEIGLNDYEAGVYLTLAGHSPASAAFIAKKLGESRSTVYTALERLIAKGLVTTTYKNEVKQFAAEPPSALEDLLSLERKRLDERFGLLRGLGAQLASMAGESAHVPGIIFFEGEESLKKIYLGMLRGAAKGSTLLVVRDEFKWEKEWSFLLEEAWKEKVRRLRKENDIGTRLLVNDSPIERKQAAYYRGRKRLEFRYLPKSARFMKFVLYVLGDTVAALSLEKRQPLGIRIINRSLAANFAQMFEAMWIASKKS
jgi:sugar-specific transcriptional regulator TrmB